MSYPAPKRLQVLISEAGIASRRASEKLILNGKVRLNGKIVRVLGTKADPRLDQIEVDGKKIELKKSEKIYFIFHKPLGVTTTLSDPHARKTIRDFFQDVKERVYPVGRLDRNTTGLLLVTNDGDLANKLMHPKFGVEKKYHVVIDQTLTLEEIKTLQSGIPMDGKKTAPCKISTLSPCRFEVILHEGRKRQIRRMMEYVGKKVLCLHRKSYGFLELGKLKPGQKRPLTLKEINELKKI